MEDNTTAQTVEEPSPNEPALHPTVEPSDVTSGSLPQPAAPKRKNTAARALIAAAAVILILAILAGGAFFGIRLYESQSLSQAKAHLAQSNWAAAEAAAEQGLSLQRTRVLADPLELIRVRGQARYYQQKYDLAFFDFDIVKDTRPNDGLPYLYQARILYDQGKLDEALQKGSEALARDNSLAFPFALQALQAYRQNKLADAATAAEAAIQRDPQLELAYRVRGSVLAWQYELDSAQADLKRALELKPNQPETLAMQAYLQFIRYQDADLETTVKAATDAGKDTAPALWAQAMLKLRLNDEDAAAKLMEQAIQKDGSRPEYYLFRALTYYKTEQEKLALADYDKALQLNPDFVPAINLRAMHLYAIYKPVDLPAEAARILKLAPKADLPHLMLAQKYTRERDWTKALEEAEKAVNAQPSPMAGLLARGDIHMEMREYDAAITDFTQAAKISPHTISGQLGLARAQISKRSYAEALKSVDEAAKLDPQSIGVHSARAMVYLAQQDAKTARKEVEEGLKRDSGSSDMIAARALIAMQEEDNLSALSDINRLGEFYPEDPRVMVLRATVLVYNKDNKGALSELTKAQKIDDKLVDLYLTRAMAYQAQNDLTNAISQAKKAVEMDPKNANAYGLLGQSELQNNKPQDGIEHLKKSLELDPSQRFSYYLLGMAQWEQGDVESALENLNKMVPMKGKLDMKVVTSARDVIGFLKTVPPAKDGLRTVKDEKLAYTIAYPTSWVPQPPEDTASGTQFRLMHGEIKGASVFQVQVIRLVDMNMQTAVSLDIFTAALRSLMTEKCYQYNPISQETFTAQGAQGLADTYECTYQDEKKNLFTVKQKIYVFSSDKAYVALSYTSIPQLFDKDVKEADKIAATFGFLK